MAIDFPSDDHVNEIISKTLRYSSLAEKTSAATQANLRLLLLQYAQLVANGGPLPSIADTGLRVFSQFDEDGILLYLLTVVGIGPRLFLDLGSGDAISGSNTANLALNLGFHGVFIDGNREAIERGKKFYQSHPSTDLYPPLFHSGHITRNNVNSLVKGLGIAGEIDVLSIDMDGNDYWIWEALEVVNPRIVVTETHIEYGMRSIVVPYDEDFEYPGLHEDYFGASMVAMNKLATKKGYRLVGANRFGFNVFFVRNDLAPDLLPVVQPEALMTHPRNAERFARFDSVKEYKFDEI